MLFSIFFPAILLHLAIHTFWVKGVRNTFRVDQYVMMILKMAKQFLQIMLYHACIIILHELKFKTAFSFCDNAQWAWLLHTAVCTLQYFFCFKIDCDLQQQCSKLYDVCLHQMEYINDVQLLIKLLKCKCQSLISFFRQKIVLVAQDLINSY